MPVDLSRCRRSEGFTIIELLVVVAVLSVLMAILLPSLGKARVLARRVACQGNLRQIALAYTAYLHANEGRFYGDKSNVMNATYAFGGWRGMNSREKYRPVNEYLGLPARNAPESDAGVFRCPADRNQDPDLTTFGSFYMDYGNSYQANLVLVSPSSLRVEVNEPWRTINTEIKAHGAAKMEQVAEPARMLWLGDYLWCSQWDALISLWAQPHGRPHYHCMAFLDGHAAFVEIVKGMYDVDGGYRVQPHRAADKTVHELQRPVLCPHELAGADH